MRVVHRLASQRAAKPVEFGPDLRCRPSSKCCHPALWYLSSTFCLFIRLALCGEASPQVHVPGRPARPVVRFCHWARRHARADTAPTAPLRHRAECTSCIVLLRVLPSGPALWPPFGPKCAATLHRHHSKHVTRATPAPGLLPRDHQSCRRQGGPRLDHRRAHSTPSPPLSRPHPRQPQGRAPSAPAAPASHACCGRDDKRPAPCGPPAAHELASHSGSRAGR